MQKIIDDITAAHAAAADKVAFVNALREHIFKLSGSVNPVDCVRLIPIEKVQANDYNPNSVAPQEMGLLYVSIDHDGYTQPVVAVYDHESDKYVIVDGFHRYSTMLRNKDIYERNHGLLPVVVLNKDIKDRMASTIRHNRARGKHSVEGMSNMVFDMLEKGWPDDKICQEIGLEAEELNRYKHITGFAKKFDHYDYSAAWETVSQIELKKKYKEAQNANQEPKN